MVFHRQHLRNTVLLNNSGMWKPILYIQHKSHVYYNLTFILDNKYKTFFYLCLRNRWNKHGQFVNTLSAISLVQAKMYAIIMLGKQIIIYLCYCIVSYLLAHIV